MTRKPTIDDVLEETAIETPAFVVDERTLVRDARLARSAVESQQTRLLYAMKSLSMETGLRALVPEIDGFHASSLFEAQLADRILDSPDEGIVHLTTPAVPEAKAERLFDLCDHVSFNSLNQWDRFQDSASDRTRCGLRVNPELSFVEDERYDPCRRCSKLGVPITTLANEFRRTPDRFGELDGLLVHANADATDYSPLLKTTGRLDERIAPLLEQVRWVNLGGGYLFRPDNSDEPLRRAIDLLETKYDVEVLFEPGASISRRAGYLVASVADIFERDGESVAVLDTTVNHVPEVFEYQLTPNLRTSRAGGSHRYILAGTTCLAGDVFGKHSFDAPLEVGDEVVFEDIGAYSSVKWHMFNGVNLPTVYRVDREGELRLDTKFQKADYFRLHGLSHDEGSSM